MSNGRESSLSHLCAEVEGATAVVAIGVLLEQRADAVSAFEVGDRGAGAGARWRVEAYSRSPLLTPLLEAELALAATAAGGRVLAIRQEKLAERDWVAENLLAFPPLGIGRFFIHGGHYSGAVPPGMIAIEVDAATAFGTGEHGSTRGCLLALDRLARRRRFLRPLDIGTGTGILAIAAARLWRCPVVARDIDPNAAAVARHNVARNRERARVRVSAAPGYRGLTARHDLVFANILARPLALLARDLSRRLAPGGRAILSGILSRQEGIVLAAHRPFGIVLERRIVIGGWSTLILHKGG